MSKKPAKAAPAADPAAPPKKRSKLKLALFACLPLFLAGGGYFGWTHFFAAKPVEVSAPAGEEGAEGHGQDTIHVASVSPEVAAETSFTHSFALSVLMAQRCGTSSGAALKAASEEEAHADGILVNLSWMAAYRRASGFTEKSCDMVMTEIYKANVEADRIAAEKAAPKKGGKDSGHH